MPSLADILLSEKHRASVISDSLRFLDTHIAGLSGLKGLSLKTGFGFIKNTRPEAVPRAIEHLLPLFIAALQPLYEEWQSGPKRNSGDFAAFLRNNAHRTAEALLAVTDARFAASASPRAKAIYNKFRGIAEAEIERAMPGIAGLLQTYLR